MDKRVIKLSSLDVLFVGVVSSFLVVDLLSQPFYPAAKHTTLTKLFDALDFNLNFRLRVQPKLSATTEEEKSRSIKSYWLVSPSVSNIQAFYIYLSALAMKFGCGALLNFCFFNELKAPVAFDVVIFNLGLFMIQFFPNDLVFNKLAFNPVYSVMHAFSTGMFKTRNVISLSDKAIKHNLNLLKFLTYVVLGMEFTGAFRSFEPFLYNFSVTNWFESIEKIGLNLLFSVDSFIDAVAGFLSAAAIINPNARILLYLFVYPLMLYRFQRKVLAKQFNVDGEKLIVEIVKGNFDGFEGKKIKAASVEVETLKPEELLITKKEINAAQEWMNVMSTKATNNFNQTIAEIELATKSFDAHKFIASFRPKELTVNDSVRSSLVVMLVLMGLTQGALSAATLVSLLSLSFYDLFVICGWETLKVGKENEKILLQYLSFWTVALPLFLAVFLINNEEPIHRPAEVVKALFMVYLLIPVQRESETGLKMNGLMKISEVLQANVNGFRDKLGVRPWAKSLNSQEDVMKQKTQ